MITRNNGLLDGSRFKVGMFARQTGKTFCTSVEIVQDCLRSEQHGMATRWLILSRGQRQADEVLAANIVPLLKACRVMLSAIASHTRAQAPKGGLECDFRAGEIRFAHGSRIISLPASVDAARGFSANVFLDEFAFHRNPEALWSALLPVVSRDGLKIRVVSTPRVCGDVFHRLMTGVGSALVAAPWSTFIRLCRLDSHVTLRRCAWLWVTRTCGAVSTCSLSRAMTESYLSRHEIRLCESDELAEVFVSTFDLDSIGAPLAPVKGVSWGKRGFHWR